MKSGSCLCGEVTDEVHGPLRNVVACHCKPCRKRTGTCMSATAAVLPRDCPPGGPTLTPGSP